MNDWVLGTVSVAAALAVSAGLALAGGDTGVRLNGVSVFLVCGVFAFLVQWLMFIHAWVKKTEHFFDLTGSLTYITVVIAAVVLSSNFSAGALTIALVILVWALRLGPFLYSRVKQAGEDRRFRSIKQSFPVFFMTWTLQGTWVFITAGCALAAISSGRSIAVDGWFVGGLLLWAFGFAVEVIADRQKTAFRAVAENQGRFITTGLWAWSRHPNYFGEIVLWCGIAVMAYPALAGWQFVTLISPVWVVILLTFISGIRMLEARAERAWGEDPAFRAYKKNTPALMLWPPKGTSGGA